MQATIRFTVPRPLKEWVDAQVAARGNAMVDDYLNEILLAEQKRQLADQIDLALLDALDSGESTPMTKADWERIRRQGRKRIAAKKRKSS